MDLGVGEEATMTEQRPFPKIMVNLPSLAPLEMGNAGKLAGNFFAHKGNR
jgi:hypothetical protein